MSREGSLVMPGCISCSSSCPREYTCDHQNLFYMRPTLDYNQRLGLIQGVGWLPHWIAVEAKLNLLQEACSREFAPDRPCPLLDLVRVHHFCHDHLFEAVHPSGQMRHHLHQDP